MNTLEGFLIKGIIIRTDRYTADYNYIFGGQLLSKVFVCHQTALTIRLQCRFE